MNRREFLITTAATAALAPRLVAAGDFGPGLEDRICGLLFGSAIGDALGGPIEFQPPDQVQRLPNPPKQWTDAELLDGPALEAAAGRLQLRAYDPLRPGVESYGQWNPHSLPGTITDDTRHKLVLLHGLRKAERSNTLPLDVNQLAQSYLDWAETDAVVGRPGYPALAADWLEEWQLGARWVLGERDTAIALPPSRMWQGLPTCSGQMTLLPIAALFPGEPDQAYRAAYDLAFFDNGFGKDLNASLVAGLATALVTPVDPAQPGRAWETILTTMRSADPYRHGQIRWTQRSVDRWLDLALKFARDADRHPARLFASLEREFQNTTKWEAQVPFVVAFSCLAIAGYQPLAALQLSMEWGHDTDSYAQLVGAFIGALHGEDVFPKAWRRAVADRLMADHGTDLKKDCQLLERLARLGKTKRIP